MVSDYRVNVYAVARDGSQVSGKVVKDRAFKGLPLKMVGKTAASMERGEFKQYVFSLPTDGIVVIMSLPFERVSDNPFSGFVERFGRLAGT